MEESKGYLGVAYLYAVINSIFIITSYICMLFIPSDVLVADTWASLLLRSAAYVLICIVLFILNKKANVKLSHAFHDDNARKIVGAVMLAVWVLNSVIQYLALQSALTNYKTYEFSPVPNIVAFGTYIVNLFVILYLIVFKKSKAKVNHQYIIGTTLLYLLVDNAFYFANKFINILAFYDKITIIIYVRLAILALIILVLFVLSKIYKFSLASSFRNDEIKKTVGLLVIVSAMFDFPQLITYAYSTITILGGDLGLQLEEYVFRYIYVNFGPVVMELILFALQIYVGMRFMKKEYYEAQVGEFEE